MTKLTYFLVWVAAANYASASLFGADEKKAEATTAQPVPREEVLQTVRLKHRDAASVANTIREVTHLPVSVLPIGGDLIVVAGTASAVQSIVEKYIPSIDVPGAGYSAATSTFLPVLHYPIGELMDLARTVAPKASIAIDELNRNIVVNGSEQAVTALRELLKQVDLPTKSVTVHFFFIRAGKPTGDTKDAALPSALQPIAKTLSDNGFSQPALLAPLMVTAQEGEKFESKSVFRSDSAGSGTDVLEFWVQGSVRLQPGEEVAQLRVNARMGGIVEPGRADYGPTFELNTSLAAKIGNYVILAAAPSSTSLGSAVALVVRIVPSAN